MAGPRALLSAGLEARLRPARVVELARPPYEFDAQPATRVRNGVTIREHALRLGEAVQAALAASRFAVVLGGDCSILLGCLLGARRDGRCGLVHLDGHSDFRHPGNYDAGSSLARQPGWIWPWQPAVVSCCSRTGRWWADRWSPTRT